MNILAAIGTGRIQKALCQKSMTNMIAFGTIRTANHHVLIFGIDELLQTFQTLMRFPDIPPGYAYQDEADAEQNQRRRIEQ
jgi:hypothetical protein